MPRILAIDYGTKRVGIAVSDELQIIASGLTTVHSKDVIVFLKEYVSKEIVESIVVGDPEPLGNEDRTMKITIDAFVRKLNKEIPHIPVFRMNERFTSKAAHRSLLEAGANKSTRRNKELVDKISATIILQDFMEYHKK